MMGWRSRKELKKEETTEQGIEKVKRTKEIDR
jgi:hypothetical protein